MGFRKGDTVLEDVLTEVDLGREPVTAVQALAEKAVAAVADFAAGGDPAAVPDRLWALLPGGNAVSQKEDSSASSGESV